MVMVEPRGRTPAVLMASESVEHGVEIGAIVVLPRSVGVDDALAGAVVGPVQRGGISHARAAIRLPSQCAVRRQEAVSSEAMVVAGCAGVGGAQAEGPGSGRRSEGAAWGSPPQVYSASPPQQRHAASTTQ